jgi:hypothetical protein
LHRIINTIEHIIIIFLCSCDVATYFIRLPTRTASDDNGLTAPAIEIFRNETVPLILISESSNPAIKDKNILLMNSRL